ncbi:MAG: Low affinity potassium transport system protein kup [Holosporales bacterium]
MIKNTMPVIGALGIVFGDIGTSPLYALKACLSVPGVIVCPESILGVVSLFIWSILLIVTVKYVHIVLRLDKDGEGGILTLSLLTELWSKGGIKHAVGIIGILGASLFLGDSMLTPALSVLSAVEGISITHPEFSGMILPLTIGILCLLFGIQKYGSGAIGHFFGPILLIWFISLFLFGFLSIKENFLILKAFNPYYALSFLWLFKGLSFAIIGCVILVVTGAEALYADLGHFGRKSIQSAWTFIALPSLVVNYLGQGALLLNNPSAISNPFYLMIPDIYLPYMIMLATLATIIASQSVLSGLFSITFQCISLNYLPKMKVVNTSSKHIGQVYIPFMNKIIFVLTVCAVLIFQDSYKMTHAYGLCVAGIMLLTGVLIFLNAWKIWKWSPLKMVLMFVPLFTLDLIFVLGNLLKFFQGAWYTFLVTSLFFYIIRIWQLGERALWPQKVMIKHRAQDYICTHLEKYPTRIPGAALFLSKEPYKIPTAMAMHLHHNKFLHEQLIIASFVLKKEPYVKNDQHIYFEKLTDGAYQIIYYFGFKESPNLTKIIHWLYDQKKISSKEDVSIFVGKGVPILSHKPKAFSKISERIFIALSSLAESTPDFYKIPIDKVIEIGVRYKI